MDPDAYKMLDTKEKKLYNLSKARFARAQNVIKNREEKEACIARGEVPPKRKYTKKAKVDKPAPEPTVDPTPKVVPKVTIQEGEEAEPPKLPKVRVKKTFMVPIPEDDDEDDISALEAKLAKAKAARTAKQPKVEEVPEEVELIEEDEVEDDAGR